MNRSHIQLYVDQPHIGNNSRQSDIYGILISVHTLKSDIRDYFFMFLCKENVVYGICFDSINGPFDGMPWEIWVTASKEAIMSVTRGCHFQYNCRKKEKKLNRNLKGLSSGIIIFF